jgi:hypothetical protein
VIRSREMRISSLLAFGLAGALVLAPASHAAVDEVSCQLNEQLLPEYKPKTANDFCPAGPAHPEDQKCHAMLKGIEDLSKAIRGGIDTNCKAIEEARVKSQQVLSQADSHAQNLAIYTDLLRTYKRYDQALSVARQDIEAKLRPVLEPHPAAPAPTTPAGASIAAESKQLKDAMKSRPALDAFDVNRVKITNDLNDAHGSKNHFAARNGFRFLKQVLAEQKNTTEAMAKLNSTITGLKKVVDNMNKVQDPRAQQPPSSTPTKGVADGLNLNSLMALATAGAGLAGMLKKQQDAADAAGDAAATSPTPASGNPAAAEKKAPAVSKLDDGKSKGSPVAIAGPAREPEAKAGPGPSVPSGNSFNDDSDISAPTPTPPGTPATTKAPGGGGGGGDAGGGGATPRELSASALPDAHKEDEALQGIGGGGLGGGGGNGGMPSSSSSDPAVAAAEEGMKDLLNDMKDTVEGGGEEPGDLQAAEGGIMDMDAEDLFPRVHAAHVRSLKQGRVLNGLGEKISPDSE